MIKKHFFTGTIILSLLIVLLAILLNAKAIASSSTEITVNNPENRAQSVRQDTGSFLSQSRSRLDVCFDVPVSELASCRQESQLSTLNNRGPVDGCFDLALSERTSCRKENN